jgi:hypothetical protein
MCTLEEERKHTGFVKGARAPWTVEAAALEKAISHPTATNPINEDTV